MTISLVHLPTPGDHFSPLTGSAVMTVIDGMASAAAGVTSMVLVAQGTYADRYSSALVREYAPARPPGRLGWLVERSGGSVGLPRRQTQASYRAALQALPAEPVDAVFLHNAPDAVPLVQPASPAWLYAHNLLFERMPRRTATALVERSAGVVTVSGWLADRLAQRVAPTAHSKLHAVLNGVRVSEFDAAPREPHEGLRVLFVGRVIPAKGPHVVLDALARLRRTDVTLRVVGSSGFALQGPLTPYEQRLRARAVRCAGPVEFVSFTPRPELPQHFAWADVVVVPSVFEEPAGLVVLEAMAAGAVVAASDSGGIPEHAGGAAVLVMPGAVDAWADALDGIRADTTWRASLAEQGRVRARQMDWRHRWPDLSGVLGVS